MQDNNIYDNIVGDLVAAGGLIYTLAYGYRHAHFTYYLSIKLHWKIIELNKTRHLNQHISHFP